MELSTEVFTNLILSRVSVLTLWRVAALMKAIQRNIGPPFWRLYYGEHYRSLRSYLIRCCLEQLITMEDRLLWSFVPSLTKELVASHLDIIVKSLFLTRACAVNNLLEKELVQPMEVAIRYGSVPVVRFIDARCIYKKLEYKLFLCSAIMRNELEIVVLFDKYLTFELLEMAVRECSYVIIEHLLNRFNNEFGDSEMEEKMMDLSFTLCDNITINKKQREQLLEKIQSM